MFEAIPTFVTLVGLWYAGAAGGKRQGRNWFVRNLLSGLIACIAAFVVFFAMISGGFAAVIGFALAAAAAVIAWKTPPAAAPVAGPTTHTFQPRRATEDEVAAAEAARVRSLNALKAATQARARDLKGATPMSAAGTERIGPAELPRLPITIRFRYMDRDGDVTVRTVDARAASTDGVNDYIEGLCHKSGKPRSFRVDRVISDITIMETGELFDPDAWFAAIPEKGRATFDGVSRGAAHRERRTAVMFVGFRDGRRHQLEELADSAGWQVRQRFSETLDMVVAGSLAGQNQLDKAAEFGAEVISEEEFRARM